MSRAEGDVAARPTLAAVARAAGVSASSFFDLKAELAKKEEEFTKSKAAGKSTSLVGGVKRPGKVRE